MNVNYMRWMTTLASAGATLAIWGCATAPGTEAGKSDMRNEAATALAKARANDPTMGPLLRDAQGYAVFPTVGKGAIGVGGAYGKGVRWPTATARVTLLPRQGQVVSTAGLEPEEQEIGRAHV